MRQAQQDSLERSPLHLLHGSGAASGDDADAAETNRDQEMVAEAKLLRQHKGRLEARMQILEDHNRQLEAQLMRLRQLLEQVCKFSLWTGFILT